MTFATFLRALQGPLIEVAIGVILFFLADWWPAFNAKAPRFKRLVMLLFCLVIPLVACGVSILLGYQANDIEASWWPAVVAGTAAFSSSQVVHGLKYLPGTVSS